MGNITGIIFFTRAPHSLPKHKPGKLNSQMHKMRKLGKLCIQVPTNMKVTLAGDTQIGDGEYLLG